MHVWLQPGQRQWCALVTLELIFTMNANHCVIIFKYRPYAYHWLMLLYLTSDFVFISPRSTYLGSSVGYLDYGLQWCCLCGDPVFKSWTLWLIGSRGVISRDSEISILARHSASACVLLNLWQATRTGFKGTQTSSASQHWNNRWA